MRMLAQIRLAILSLMFLETCLGSHPVLSAQEFFKADTLPRDWMSPQPLTPRLKALAGGEAINCGYAVPSGLRATDVSDCALPAYASRKSFYARYDLEGIDSLVAVGFAFDGQKAYAVTWMVGLGGRQTLDVKDCALPVTLRKMKSGRLDCFPPDASAEPYILEPQYEPY
jgi:hypothetical protein